MHGREQLLVGSACSEGSEGGGGLTELGSHDFLQHIDRVSLSVTTLTS